MVDGHIDGKQTNYDRIRNMSIEEMARFLNNNIYEDEWGGMFIEDKLMLGINNIKEWLESEIDEKED